jgi:hypothetical protein
MVTIVGQLFHYPDKRRERPTESRTQVANRGRELRIFVSYDLLQRGHLFPRDSLGGLFRDEKDHKSVIVCVVCRSALARSDRWRQWKRR